MKENNEIPQSIQNEAKDLITCYGNNLAYCGLYDGYSVYQFVFSEQQETGFPFVYLYDTDEEKVIEITGFQALMILQNVLDIENK